MFKKIYKFWLLTFIRFPFANIFSHITGFLFILLMIFFVLQKFLILMKPQQFILPVSLASGDMSSKKLVWTMSKTLLPVFGVLWFHTNFRIVCSNSVKKNAGCILIGTSLNVQFALGSIDILTIFVRSIHKHGMFLCLFVSSSMHSSVFYSFQSRDLLPFWLVLFLVSYGFW